MTKKVCIQLKKEADEATRVRFYQTVEKLTKLFEGGFKSADVPNSKNVYPVRLIEMPDSTGDVVWFEIDEYIESLSKGDLVLFDNAKRFKSLSRLEMERNRIGDKYEIIMNPESGKN